MLALILICSGLSALTGAFLNWRYRDYMNPDGMSYLDLARNALRLSPSALVNAHWSPLYPALLSAWLWFAKPSAYSEFRSIHVLMAFIYAGNVAGFAYFLIRVHYLRRSYRDSFASQCVFILFSFAVFLFLTNMDVTAFVITPDLLVSICALLAAALFFRIVARPDSTWPYLALGAALGVGYLCKSVMLPAGLILLAILFVVVARSKPCRWRVLLSAIALLSISLPQIVLVTREAGNLSMSETGRLNYLWWVQGVTPFEGWTGAPNGEKPLHGPRVLLDKPEVLEFGYPIRGTYPLWYDPAYWYAGARTHLSVHRQYSTFISNLQFFWLCIRRMPLLAIGGAALFAMALWNRRKPRAYLLLFLCWPLAVLGMYLLLYVEYRYAAPFLTILTIVVFTTLLGKIGRLQNCLLALIALSLIVPSVTSALAPARRLMVPDPAIHGYYFVESPTSNGVSRDEVVARALTSFLKPGDRIAVVGDGFVSFYAHIDQLKIAAEIPGVWAFWHAGLPEQQRAEAALERVGVKALIARDRPVWSSDSSWRYIRGTDYSVLLLPRNNQ